MNRFVHRIVSRHGGGSNSSHRLVGGGMVGREEFHRRLSRLRLVWLGEFHSEPRIIALLNDTLLSWQKSLEERSSKRQQQPPPRLHVVLEHFSVEMQDLLDRFQTDPDFGFPELQREYQEIGTEGHGLDPYRSFLMYCKNGTFDLDTGDGNSKPEWDIEDPTPQVQDMVLRDHLGTQKNGSTDEAAASSVRIQLHGGFLPRPYASRWNKAGNIHDRSEVLEELYAKDFLPPPTSPMHTGLWSDPENLLFRGDASHFRLVQSMMSGDDLYDEELVADEAEDEADVEIGTSTPLERLYQAQLLKDHAAAYHLSKLLLEHPTEDRFLVLAGIGHLKHRLGIPECLEHYLRAQTLHGGSREAKKLALDVLLDTTQRSALVGPQMLYETEIEDNYPPLEVAIERDNEHEDGSYVAHKQAALNDLFVNQPALFDKLVLESDVIQQRLIRYDAGKGSFAHPSCDYCFVYDEDDDNLLEEAGETTRASSTASCPHHAEANASVAAKEETLDAYNSVGASAFRKGNLVKAKTIMKHLHYTEEDMELIGDDCLYNFQGVANPHKEANLQPGEAVLDVGSGLGVDSFLAAARVGESGSVVGVDLAPKQVAHANVAAKARKIDDRVSFVQGDAERLSVALEKGSISQAFDVCISNGAFCLIPDKEKAFREIYRSLKPGGRMAVSTTTIQDRGNDGSSPNHEWPLCMKMFASLGELKPMCEGIGFENVRIADAESPMEMELSEEVYQAAFGGSEDNPDRFKIHGKEKYADQYKYLEDMDMDELCKVVTVCATKPRIEKYTT